MLFKRFYDENLAQASYLIACEKTREAIIVDPNTDIGKGHLPLPHHTPLAALPDRLHELDRNAPIVLQCQGGERSAIATSFLQSRGISRVSNLAGGLQAWVAEGFEVESERPTARGSERGEN